MSIGSSSCDQERPGPSNHPQPSILDTLKAARPSDLACKRKVCSNCPKRRARGSGSSEPKSIKPHDRVTEFPDECLSVTGKTLFCKACREELSLRRNIVANHIASKKHKSGKEKLAVKEARERDIAQCLKSHDAVVHPIGETLPWSSEYTG